MRGQWDIQRTIDAMLALTRQVALALLKLVEDKANGPAIIQLLNGRMPGIVAISPKDSKMARCVSVAPAIEAGDIHVPDPRFISGSEWVEEFLLEFSRFPRGSHDDQVDAATQALDRLVTAGQSSGISIGIIGGRIGKGVYAGSNLPQTRASPVPTAARTCPTPTAPRPGVAPTCPAARRRASRITSSKGVFSSASPHRMGQGDRSGAVALSPPDRRGASCRGDLSTAHLS